MDANSVVGRSETRPFFEGLRKLWLSVMALLGKLNWLLLKPYGNTLCTEGASFFIGSERTVIFVMACAEGISWGYLGYHVGGAKLAWQAGAFTALATATIVWMVDATFITLDRARAFYQENLTGSNDGSSQTAEAVKMVGGIAGRLMIVVTSLFFSAPYLSQLVFTPDIESYLRNENASRIAAARANVAKPYQDRIQKLKTDLDQARRTYVNEVQGTKGTLIKGKGRAADGIDLRIRDVQEEISVAKNELETTLRAFDRESPQELARKYNIALLDGGLRARGEVLDKLLANAQYNMTEWAIRGFLFFLFVGLVVLKWFQPRSVQIYYSENLQGLYTEFMSGRFNRYLEQVEWPVPEGKGMNPIRFEDWCLNTYPTIRQRDLKARQTGELQAQYESQLDRLVPLRDRLEGQIAPFREALKTTTTNLEALQRELAGVEAERRDIERQIKEKREARATINDTLSALQGEEFAVGVRHLPELDREIAAHERHRVELEARTRTLEDAVGSASKARNASHAELNLRESTLQSIEQQIQDSHIEYAAGLKRIASRLKLVLMKSYESDESDQTRSSDIGAA